ncbi:MAG: FAD binding domain-containing protein [Pseudomonadota bacterium]|nr:FAD binding domain-containing protein [Pseudomonadota bacterium]
MKPAPFSYHRASSIEDALSSLAAAEGMAAVLAGGQSLVPMLNLRLSPVDHLVDLAMVSELSQHEADDYAIHYGALTTHSAFEDHAVPDGTNGLMPFMAARIAYRAIRNRGTLGGALALADPAADWLTTAVALDATLTLVSDDGRRQLPVSDFVVGPYFTQIAEQEIIERVTIARRSKSERWGCFKMAPKVGEYAKSIAVALVDREQGTASVVIGAWNDVPLRLENVAQALLNQADKQSLTQVAAEELIEKGPALSAAERRLHHSSILRAASQATA